MHLELAQITEPFILSIKTISISAILFMIIGIPISFILSNKNLKFKWILDTIVTMPLIFPPIAMGFFLLILLGRNSMLGTLFNHFDITLIFSFSGIVIAAFIAGLPLMVKPLQASIEQFPKNIKESAYISGKSEINTFLFIVLPNIKNSLFISLLIATARALGEVGITLMLGGNIIGKTDTVSLAIYNAVFDGEYDLAMALSGILIIISIVFFICLNLLQKKKKIY